MPQPDDLWVPWAMTLQREIAGAADRPSWGPSKGAVEHAMGKVHGHGAGEDTAFAGSSRLLRCSETKMPAAVSSIIADREQARPDQRETVWASDFSSDPVA